jgi:hypothetical protein
MSKTRAVAKPISGHRAPDTPVVRERLEALGMGIPPLAHRSPEYLARFATSEIKKWSGPIRAANITLD